MIHNKNTIFTGIKNSINNSSYCEKISFTKINMKLIFGELAVVQFREKAVLLPTCAGRCADKEGEKTRAQQQQLPRTELSITDLELRTVPKSVPKEKGAVGGTAWNQHSTNNVIPYVLND